MSSSRRILLAFAVAFGLIAALGASPASAARPLVGQWHLDEYESLPNEGPMITPDSSGFDRDLRTCNGCATFDTGGRFGNHWSDASGGGMTGPGIRPQRVTLMAWVRTTGFGQDQRIAGQATSGGCTGLSYDLNTGGDTTGGLQFRIRQPGGAYVSSPRVTGSGSDGQWHQIAGTFDGATVRFYFDGNEVGNGAAADASSIEYLDQLGSFGMGDFDGGASGAGCFPAKFSGDIDELRVYDRALTAAEIERLADATGPNPPNLPADPEPGQPKPPPPGPPAPEPPSPDAKPQALFTAPSSVPARQYAVLDAGGTVGATSLLWDVDSNGTTDFVRSPADRVLAIQMPVERRLNVTLTAVSPSGSSSTTRPVLFGGPRLPSGLPSAVLPPPRAISAPAPAAIGGSGARFCTQSTVVFGLTEAEGCFTRVDTIDAVPAAESAVVRQHYANETFNRVVASLCAQAARGEIAQSRCDDAKKMFGTTFEAHVATRTMKLNGISITPSSGASIVVYPKQQRLVASRATVRWKGVPLKVNERIDFNLGNGAVRTKPSTGPPFPMGKAKLFAIDTSKIIPGVAGFDAKRVSNMMHLEGIDGRRYSTGLVTLSLPPRFKTFGGSPPRAVVKLAATNAGGPVVDDLEMNVPEANLGPVRLTDLSFKYKRTGGIDDRNPGTACARDEWKARGNISLTGKHGGGLKMTPPPPQNGLGFCAGSFKHLGMDFFFPKPKPQLFPGVTVESIGFGVQLDPTLVRGRGGVAVGDISQVDGEVLIAAATPQQPYVMGPGEPRRFDQLRGRRFTRPTIAVGGAVNMKVPGSKVFLPLGDAALMYSFPDFMAFGGKVSLVLPGMALYGGADGSANAARREFNFHVGGEACLAGLRRIRGIPLKPCLGGDAHVSSKGVVACVKPFGIDAGAGLIWGEVLPTVWVGSCYPSRYWVQVQGAQASRSNGRLAFRVAPGESLKQVRIRGKGGAPSVEIRGPGGEVVRSETDGMDGGETITTLRQSEGRVIWVGVKDGAPGRYTVTALPGSAELETLAGTRPGYDLNFRARVTGRGAKRTLRYDARRKGGGQSVTFYEEAQDVFRPIATSKGGRGTKRFTPALGGGGVRRIVARATLDGIPVPPRTVARFRAPAPAATGRPRRVRVRRRGTRLSVRWTRVPGATRYGIVLQQGNRSDRVFTAGRRRGSVRIRRVARDFSGAVRVTAQGVLGDWGRPRTVRLRRAKRPFSVLQTGARNEKRTLAKRDRAARRRR